MSPWPALWGHGGGDISGSSQSDSRVSAGKRGTKSAFRLPLASSLPGQRCQKNQQGGGSQCLIAVRSWPTPQSRGSVAAQHWILSLLQLLTQFPSLAPLYPGLVFLPAPADTLPSGWQHPLCVCCMRGFWNSITVLIKKWNLGVCERINF